MITGSRKCHATIGSSLLFNSGFLRRSNGSGGQLNRRAPFNSCYFGDLWAIWILRRKSSERILAAGEVRLVPSRLVTGFLPPTEPCVCPPAREAGSHGSSVIRT